MKNKIITLSLILTLFSCLFINNISLAVSHDFIIPEGVENYIIAQRYPHSDSEYYVLLYSPEGSHWKVYGSTETYFTIMCYKDANFTQPASFYRVFIHVNERDFNNQSGLSFTDGNFSIYNDVIYSTEDIYASNGQDIFFQAPPMGLMETTMEMIAEKTPAVGTRVAQTMRIILLCGVGCLALLITLYLLARTFYRYR